MKLKIAAFSAFCFLFTAVCFCGGGTSVVKSDNNKTYTIKLNLKKGSRWIVKSDIHTEQSSYGGRSVISMMGHENSFEVIEKSENGYIVEKTFNTRFANSGGRIRPIKDLNGKNMKYTINSNGLVNKIESDDELIIKRRGRKTDMKNDVSELFIKYPENPVKAGDSWTQQVKRIEGTAGKGILSGELVYTIIEETNKNGIPALKILCKGNTQNQYGNTTGPAEKTEISRELIIALETGLILESKLNSKMVMETQMRGKKVTRTAVNVFKTKTSF